MRSVPTTERALVALILAAAIAVPLLPRTGLAFGFGLLALATLLALALRLPAAATMGVLLSVFSATLLAGRSAAQIGLPAALLAYALCVRGIPWLRGFPDWFRIGRMDRTSILLGTASVLVSSAALALWCVLLDPDLRDLVETFVPDVSLWLLLPGALLFSMINAAVEEAVYRGVLQQSVGAVVPGAWLAVVGQALPFGALHIHGFPRGAVGVALACVYGLMMGLLRARCQGMLLPWLAHVATDAAIALLVLFLFR